MCAIAGKTYTTKLNTHSDAKVCFTFRKIVHECDNHDWFDPPIEEKDLPIGNAIEILSDFIQHDIFIEVTELKINKDNNVVYKIPSTTPDDVLLSAGKVRAFLGLYQDGILDLLKTGSGNSGTESLFRTNSKARSMPSERACTTKPQNYSEATVSIAYRLLTYNIRGNFWSDSGAQVKMPIHKAIKMLDDFNHDTESLNVEAFQIKMGDRVDYEFSTTKPSHITLSAKRVKELFKLYHSHGPDLLPTNIGGTFPHGMRE